MENILLSICIPTYNRSNIVYENVKKYLKFIPDNVEIVVSDNHSEDNTVELLKTIYDKRFKLYKNKENKGMDYNINKVIRVAKGDFALLMSDEDIVDNIILEKVLKILDTKNSRENISAFIFNNSFENDENFTREDELLSIVNGQATYCSGNIYNKLKMTSNDFRVVSDGYTHLSYLFKLWCRGTIYYSKLPLVIVLENHAFRDENTKPINFTAPERRLAQFKQDKDIILPIEGIDDNLKGVLLNKIFITKFIHGLLTYNLLSRKVSSYKELDIDDSINKFRLVAESTFGKSYNTIFNDAKDYIVKTINNRKKFDYLVNKGYHSVFMINDRLLNDDRVKMLNLLSFKFNVDYIYSINSEILLSIDYEFTEKNFGEFKDFYFDKFEVNEVNLGFNSKNNFLLILSEDKYIDLLNQDLKNNFEIICYDDLRVYT